MEISGGVVLITGGASGLGAACGEWFASLGARVVLADIDESGEALARRIGPAARFIPTDVLDSAQIAAAISLAESEFGPLSVAIQCAGVLAGSRVLGRSGMHDLDLFRRVVAINLIGTFDVARQAAAAMARRDPDPSGERGVIINTSSVSAWEGQIGQAAYAASKGGVASLTMPMARELASHGIRVAAIAPGVFETPMMAAASPNVRESLQQQMLFPPRFGEPREFAMLAEQIVRNPMLNGTTLRLDGAVRLTPR